MKANIGYAKNIRELNIKSMKEIRTEVFKYVRGENEDFESIMENIRFNCIRVKDIKDIKDKNNNFKSVKSGNKEDKEEEKKGNNNDNIIKR